MNPIHPILRATPCTCCRSRRAMTFTHVPNGFELRCHQCGTTETAPTIDQLVDQWNHTQTQREESTNGREFSD